MTLAYELTNWEYSGNEKVISDEKDEVQDISLYEGATLIPKGDPRASRGLAARRRPLPTSWNIVHVMDRIEEAVDVLGRMPVMPGPRGHSNSMPDYAYTIGDLNAQAESGELEKMLRANMKPRIPVTAAEITRMQQALRWPAVYLRSAAGLHVTHMAEVSRAVINGALWNVTGANIGKRCRGLNLTTRAFYRQQMHGVEIITRGLIRDDVPVT